MAKKRSLNFTENRIAKLQPEAKRYAVADGGKGSVEGLQVRVSPTGVKIYSVRAKLDNGARVGVTLGDVSKFSVDQARTLARLKIFELMRGTNPNEVKRTEREEAKANALTLEVFLNDAYGTWARTNRKDGARNLPRLKAAFKALLSKPLKEIAARDVEEWRSERIKKEWARAAEMAKKAKDDKAGAKNDDERAAATWLANKAKETFDRASAAGSRDIALLKACLSRAAQMGYLESNVLEGKRGVKLAKVDRKTGIRAITPDEERRLFDAVAKRENEMREHRASHNEWLLDRKKDERPELGTFTSYLRPYLTLLLHTGLRRREGFLLQWKDVDFKGAELRIRAETTKSGKKRDIPLNSASLDALLKWHDQSTDIAPDALVFPSPQTGEALTHINTAWRNVTKQAGLKGLRLHDLRHTFATRALDAGATIKEVQSLLGHTDISTTAIYLHDDKEGLARAVERLASQTTETVVSFSKAEGESNA